MRMADLIAFVLVIVGAANWALVGMLEFDLVAAIVGEEFGTVNIVSRAVYNSRRAGRDLHADPVAAIHGC